MKKTNPKLTSIRSFPHLLLCRTLLTSSNCQMYERKMYRPEYAERTRRTSAEMNLFAREGANAQTARRTDS